MNRSRGEIAQRPNDPAPRATLGRLRCEYRDNPLGIDATHPRLSWVAFSTTRGMRQSAFQILVARSEQELEVNGSTLWDSGKIPSSSSIQIEYAGKPLSSRECCYWKVRVWDENDRVSPWSETAFWSMGLLEPGDWQANWIGVPEEVGCAERVDPPVPGYFRKTFSLEAGVRRAFVYSTALGVYELHLNGERVGDHLLSPEWTDYRKRVQYQTYDVTALIRPGPNALAALLGNGWYCGDWQFWESKLRPIYGQRPWLMAQLEVEYEDGRRERVCTDSTWRCTSQGPLRFAGIYEGETFDARMIMPGWNDVSFDDGGWESACSGSPEAGRLVWQRSEPIRVTQEIKPVSLTEPIPGTYVYDFGQNLAGWCRIQLREPDGNLVTLKHNEMLSPDGTVYMDNLHAGHLSGGDRQIVRYIGNGSRLICEPHFSYQGFRYVEVTGLAEPPTLDLLVARVIHTSFAQTGSFTCSSPLLNQLARNIQWSQRANIMGIPTDCCQRDERCGYTGDMNFFMPTAVFNYDMAAFFNKWLVDLRQDSQMPDGHFADHAPTYGPGDGWNVGWSDAGIICPHLMYRTYGDLRVIQDHYVAMRRNMELQIATSHNGRRGPEGIGNGDWLNLGGGASQEVIGTAYYAYDLQLMAEMAGAISEYRDKERYARLAAEARTAFLNGLVDQNGRIRESSQAGYALAFTMGLVPPDCHHAMSEQFANEIARFDGHLATGFIGTPRLLPGLHFSGRDDLAYQLLLNDTHPSWLFQVTQGATTIWERWNGSTPGAGFADSGMNSFNHYAFGSVGEYLFRMVGGIQEISPGYQEFQVQPVMGDGLAWAEAWFESPYGRISSHWRRDARNLTMEVVVPANTTARIIVPTAEPLRIVDDNNEVIEGLAGEVLRHAGREQTVFSLGSGHYRFSTAGLE